MLEYINKWQTGDLNLKGHDSFLKFYYKYTKTLKIRIFHDHLYRCTENRERIKRRWLVYSISTLCFLAVILIFINLSLVEKKVCWMENILENDFKSHETNPDHFNTWHSGIKPNYASGKTPPVRIRGKLYYNISSK